MGNHREENKTQQKLLNIFQSEEEEIIKLKQKVNSLCNRCGIGDAEVLYLIRKEQDYRSVPVEIFSQRLSPLEALVSYLKKNQRKRYCEIAKILSRDERTVWVTYAKSQRKQKVLFIPEKSRAKIPLALFRDRHLSVLEIISSFLCMEKQLRLTDISEILCKNTSTIWTALNRAREKQDKTR